MAQLLAANGATVVLGATRKDGFDTAYLNQVEDLK
jgi:hypothetical protein